MDLINRCVILPACNYSKMRTVWWITIFVLVWSPAVMSILPKTAMVTANGNLEVTCNDGQKKSLDKCFFRVWLENDIGENPQSEPMDFSKGSDSETLTRKRDNNDDNFKGKYYGEGLDKGDCGVDLFELTEGRYFVQCRVRVRRGQWMSEFMSLVVNSSGKIEKKEEPSVFLNQTVNNMEDSRAFVFNAPNNIQDCELFLPEKPAFRLTQNVRTKSDSSYEGSLEGRKCSVTLRKVALGSSGLIWALYREAGESEWKAFQPQIINVIAIPGLATLTKSRVTQETATATCSVPEGRPPARVRWEVDGKVVREDDASSVDAWYWPWDSQPVTQRLEFNASGQVDTSVTCHVFHPDFNKEVMPALTEVVEKVTDAPMVGVPTTPPRSTPQAPNGTTTTVDKPDDTGDSDLSALAIFGIVASFFMTIIIATLAYFAYKHKEKVFNVIGYRQSGSWPAKGWEEICILNAQKLPPHTGSGRGWQEVRILGAEKPSAGSANCVWEELSVLDAQRWPTEDGSGREQSVGFWEKVRIVVVEKSENGSAADEGEELRTLIPKLPPIDADSGSGRANSGEELPVLFVEKLPTGAASRNGSTNNKWDDVRIFIVEKPPAVVGSGQANSGEKKIRILAARKSPTDAGTEDGRV